MFENAWFCQKCGNKNDGPSCSKCGYPKLKEVSAYGAQFHIWALIDFALVLGLFMVLVDAIPAFGDVFKQYGERVPWLTGVICGLGYFLQPIGRVVIIAIGCLGGLFFFSPQIKKQIQLHYLIYFFLFMLILWIFLLVGMFSPMIYLGELAK